jgi:NADPH:quinone reductase-like Zn-dependent oxidoreductase
MRAWQIESFGIDSLEFAERPTPTPGAGEVLVEIRAISFNFRDLLAVKGIYNPKMSLPRIPCSDAAGVVAAVGPGVTAFQPGDRVSPIFMQNWLDGELTPEKARGALGGDIDGVLAEFIVVKESGLVAIPEHLSFEEASTLPCAAVTAWNALAAAQLRPGATVVVQGTGGVSIFALQLARLQGARVLGISSSDEKLQMAQSLGLDAGLNYRTHPDWEHWVQDETGGQGADLVVEVGGLGTLPHSLRAVRTGGMIAQIGVLSQAGNQASGPEPLPLAALLHKQIRIQGIYVGSRANFVALNRAVTLAQLRPVGENFHWSQARKALWRMEEATHFGKLVLSVN